MNFDPFDNISFKALFDWCLSDDPLEGDWWEFVCSAQGVDPEKFAEMVTDMRQRLPADDRKGIADRVELARKRLGQALKSRRFYSNNPDKYKSDEARAATAERVRRHRARRSSAAADVA